MATTLAIQALTAGIRWDYESVQAFGNPSSQQFYTYAKTLANGTGAGNANKLYIAQDNTGITASGTLTIDLTNLTDVFGNALSFGKVKAFYFENLAAAEATTAAIGGGTNPQVGAAQIFTGTTPAIRVKGGGVLQLAGTGATGYTVDGTHKTLVITNESGSAGLPYRLAIVGE